MHSLYIATSFAGALVCLLASVLLFSRRKDGERSRIILAVIVFFSVVNYIPRFISLSNGIEPDVIVSVPLMLVGIFMILSYLLYPIEVISPGWLKPRRVFILFLPLMIFVLIYIFSLWAGVTYTEHKSLMEMFPLSDRFEIWFRLFIIAFIIMTVPIIYFIPYSGKYNNTDRIWIRKYELTLSINIIAYLLVLTVDNIIIHTSYYYISVGCSLYIVYMELFVRLINKRVPIEADVQFPQSNKPALKSRNELLLENLDTYMQETSAWRNPDLTLGALASALCTNRTTLAKVIQEGGYTNYTLYINNLRVNDFIKSVTSNSSVNFQEAFFDAGFRSRATALRHFRQLTGMIPSEYFLEKSLEAEATDSQINNNVSG
jgi:AraC-like DNA-binding protein